MPARTPSTTAMRRTVRRARRPRRESPVTTMATASSAVTSADRPNHHDGSQRKSALIVSAADNARPAGRLTRRPPITAAMTKAAPATIAHVTDEAAIVANPAAAASTHHGLDAPAHATKPAKHAVRTTSAGRAGCRMGAGHAAADGRRHRDRGDDDRIALGDPVAADPLRRPRPASRRRHRRPSWWTTTDPPRRRPGPSRRRRPSRRATSPAGRRPSTPPARRRSAAAARAPG